MPASERDQLLAQQRRIEERLDKLVREERYRETLTPEQRQYRIGEWYGRTWTTKTITTDNTQPFVPPHPVDEEHIRKIVREEIAELPIPFDVPDAPPEGEDR